MERLTSFRNPRVILWRSLGERKARLETGLFLIEGYKMVQEAFEAHRLPEALLIREDQLDRLPAGLPDCESFLLPANVFDAVCDVKTPQGIAAVLKTETLPPAVGSRLIALDDVQDPGNVGTILRTADAAGMTGVLLSRGCADVFSPKVLRATMGSIFRMGITVTDDLPEALRGLKNQGFSILSSQLDGSPFYRRETIPEPYCLIVGNEGNGISEAVRATATHRLKLPMRGGAESLNAAVAAGIMMYDLTKNLDRENPDEQ